MSRGPEVYQTGDVGEGLRVRGGVKEVKLIGDEVANELGLRGLTWLIFELALQYIGDLLYNYGGLCRVASAARG